MDKRDVRDLKLFLLVLVIWGLLFLGKWGYQRWEHLKKVEAFYDFYFDSMQGEGE